MPLTKKYRFSLIVLVIGMVFFLIVAICDYKEGQEIKNNAVETIALVTNATIRRSAQSLEYTFFYEGFKIEAIDTQPSGPLKEYIGKYFKVLVSSSNPNHSEIVLDNEIQDTALIKAAGFKKN